MRVRSRLVVAAGSLAGPATASHSWGTYQWERTTNRFTLELGDTTSSGAAR